MRGRDCGCAVHWFVSGQGLNAMFTTPTVTATDSETEIREFLVAPMLIVLGYGEPQIETELNIQSQFGGLRRPLRADYVVSVDHKYDLPPNRLVIEVKRPSVSIASAEVIEQATVYGAHPSIQASHLIITNGWQIAIVCDQCRHG